MGNLPTPVIPDILQNTNNHFKNDISSPQIQQIYKQIQQGINEHRIAPFSPALILEYLPPDVVESILIDCPICCFHYEFVNHTECCQQVLCTECLFRVSLDCLHQNETTKCPFCTKVPLIVTFEPPPDFKTRLSSVSHRVKHHTRHPFLFIPHSPDDRPPPGFELTLPIIHRQAFIRKYPQHHWRNPRDAPLSQDLQDYLVTSGRTEAELRKLWEDLGDMGEAEFLEMLQYEEVIRQTNFEEEIVPDFVGDFDHEQPFSDIADMPPSTDLNQENDNTVSHNTDIANNLDNEVLHSHESNTSTIEQPTTPEEGGNISKNSPPTISANNVIDGLNFTTNSPDIEQNSNKTSPTHDSAQNLRCHDEILGENHIQDDHETNSKRDYQTETMKEEDSIT
ncbi:hypothetical protein BLNAU_213 [Blattamonas nauphoetae]|uniref:RING-type domain-containing protein n=1 Tax=Blattamonas nauphoetae TaxID=2049346 RepID=A0ABQ9YMC9_9EUKA|nr:hypothetical protein BLNAU_213 [Blattamonas nauphoetae]